MKRLVPAFLYCFFLSSIAYSQNGPFLSVQKIRQLDSIATQDVPANAPGIVTGIVKNGSVVYEKYAGYADLGDSAFISSNTRFNMASNGKQFTALAILMLEHQNKLSLSDDIRKYFPAFFTSVNDRITISNLLNHSSGIRDVYDLWSLQGLTWWEFSFTNDDVIKLVARQKELNFKPGSKYLYSNTNYILLASIIEKVAGKSFILYTNELFKKLNMPNTSFENDYSKIRGPIAKAYFNFDSWTTYQWIWNVCGDGNIFSTLSDQLQWEKIIQTKSNSSIPQKIIEKSQHLIDRSPIKKYGYGLEFGMYKGLDYQFHEGATGAWKATVVRFPAKQVSAVTLTNTGKSIPSMQTRQMMDIVFDLKKDDAYFVTKPVKTGKFVAEADMIGVYLTDNNFAFQFEKRDTSLYLKRIGRNDIRIVREADNIFHQSNDPDFKQEFKRNSQGEMEVTAYYTSHSPYTLKRVNNNWNSFDYNSLDGMYVNDETGVMISIRFSGDKNYEVKIGKGDSTKGLLITPNKLLVDNYVFEMGNNKNTGVKKFLLSGGRIQNVGFKRVNYH